MRPTSSPSPCAMAEVVTGLELSYAESLLVNAAQFFRGPSTPYASA